MRKRLAAGILGLFLAGITVEISCQLYTLYLVRSWAATREAPGHYYVASSNPAFAYELASNFDFNNDARRLSINQFGIREQEDEIPMPGTHKLAILGDSVVFGIGHSQEQTISSLLQDALNRSGMGTKVLNFGVPGYNLHELVEHLKVKNAIYKVDRLIYVLNPNDFSRRQTVYEGADAGLYRMYRRPMLKSLWFIRKAIYRWHKYDSVADYRDLKASVGWYEWLFEGNEDAAFADLAAMASYADQRAIDLTVALLPVGVAYDDRGSYRLAEMFKTIETFLEANDIGHINPVDRFGSDAMRYFDLTDHLTEEGNLLMAEILQGHLATEHIDQAPLTPVPVS